MSTDIPLYLFSLVDLWDDYRIDGREAPLVAEGKFDGDIDVSGRVQIYDGFAKHHPRKVIDRRSYNTVNLW